MRRVMRAVSAAAIVSAIPLASAHAGSPYGPYGEYPAPEAYPFRRSTLTPQVVAIPPYDRAFRVRVYTTPPQQPFYNVPPYAVITPY